MAEELVTLYRVEHIEGNYGPYQSSYPETDEGVDFAHDLVETHSGCPFHPTPTVEGIKWKIPNDMVAEDLGWDTGTHIDPMALAMGWQCAFESLDALHRWFEGYIDDLIEHGFGVFELEVYEDYVAYGDYQVIYDPSEVYAQTQLTFAQKEVVTA